MSAGRFCGEKSLRAVVWAVAMLLYGSAARARAGLAPFLRLAPTARQCFARARCANAQFFDGAANYQAVVIYRRGN